MAKAIALRKVGKTTYSNPKSYRPISLLSNISKVMEAVMNRWHMKKVESRCVLSPYQFGFRAGREMMDACCRLVKDITAAFRREHQVQCITLDIQVANNKV